MTINMKAIIIIPVIELLVNMDVSRWAIQPTLFASINNNNN